MPIRSMTGFGRATVTAGDTTYSVEVRAVNHRFLELRLRLPPAFGHLEASVRGVLNARFRRGRIDFNAVSSFEEDTRVTGVSLNLPLARSVVAAHESLGRALGVPVRLDTALVAGVAGVLTAETRTVVTQDLESAFLVAVSQAADALVAMRGAEGEALSRELSRRLDAVDSLRTRVEQRAPEQTRAYRKRLETRMRELLAGLDFQTDQGRILHEVGVFAEKVDVAEELIRLASHLAQARNWLVDDSQAGDDGIGRRLDFLCQEMHREANTIGSKVQDIDVSELVIDLKAELERLREQVQNVE